MKHVEYYGYTIYEDGTVISKYGHIRKPVEKNGRLEMRFILPEGAKTYPLARIVYAVFHDDFDITDKNQCITQKDGNKMNAHLNNLECKFRGDLIQGDRHNKIAKITDKQAEQIRKDYQKTLHNRPVNQFDAEGEYNSYRSLAKKYGLTYPSIKMIVEGNCRDNKKYKLKKDE